MRFAKIDLVAITRIELISAEVILSTIAVSSDFYHGSIKSKSGQKYR